ncbi:ATP-dependent metallopeptidase FtsH/Yme1/Tma family protein [Clostridium sp. SYSU_GA19001]|uniref:ATP-dependent metallopeptidase FtsH/Yme1/Tma family protein n=1 Tax=Clostridium caldaquaticum TaxID=2940653 RepID=UPI0020775518|nr:ATP-dependent metallopeptidase FtsH/Yme1/Tma family protein [Clostridium caldaquaticum]MCM8711163.1 ATP-dependent metallopeptidase FtsH/Yme1/Tma family protein [Clostridium caldaquaticum]
MDKKNKKNSKYMYISIFIAILSLIMLIVFNFNNKSSAYKLYVDFLKDIQSKSVSTVYITNTPKIKVKMNDGNIYETDNPRTNNFKEELLKQGVKVSENLPLSAKETIPTILLSASLVFMAVMAIKSSGISSKRLKGVDNLDVTAVSNVTYNFDSVAGNEEAKESVKDIVDFLKNPEKYSAYGARMPKGIMFYGEPGTGKTLLAKAVAGEANVPFYAISGSDFVQVYVGVGASRVRQLFKKARNHGKAVIFIDEIDAIGKKRDGGKTGGSDEKDQTLNALLTEMSGFNEKEGIIVIAATNRLDVLDPALLRPGRFDRHIEITLPDLAAREKILALHLKNKPTMDINIHDWAQKTSYFSGAKLESLVNEAAILAAKEDSKFIDNTHMDKAYSIVLAGYEKIERNHIKDKDKKITAYHEAGHALLTLKVLPDDKLSKVTIIPTSKGAGGYTLSIPEDKLYQNKDYLKKRIMVLLAGRAAEEIIFGKEYITTGAYNDFQQTTRIVSSMVTQYGMGETIGLLNLEELSHLNYSNTEDIIKECKETLDSLYEEVKSIILKDKILLDKIAENLIQKETLLEKDIKELIAA